MDFDWVWVYGVCMSENTFDVLGWDDSMESAAKEAITKPSTPKKDPRICSCGHPARAHATEGVIPEVAAEFKNLGQEQCQYARMRCSCSKFTEVGTCESPRYFTFKTSGVDGSHALIKGIEKAKAVGVEFKWTHLEKTACAVCGENAAKRHLVALDRLGSIIVYSGMYNVFLCEEHFIEKGGARL